MPDVAIGRKLKQVRDSRDLTQEQLAREVGVSWVTISRYERDVTQPSIMRLRVLADALGVEITELLEEAVA